MDAPAEERAPVVHRLEGHLFQHLGGERKGAVVDRRDPAPPAFRLAQVEPQRHEGEGLGVDATIGWRLRRVQVDVQELVEPLGAMTELGELVIDLLGGGRHAGRVVDDAVGPPGEGGLARSEREDERPRRTEQLLGGCDGIKHGDDSRGRAFTWIDTPNPRCENPLARRPTRREGPQAPSFRLLADRCLRCHARPHITCLGQRSSPS